MDADFKARADVRELLAGALDARNSEAGKAALEQLVANADIAAEGRLPLCQDCGYITVFAAVGQDVSFDGPFEPAVQAGVVKAHRDGFLRQSVIKDALKARTEPETDRPATVYVKLVPGATVTLDVFPKGGGSDNAGRLVMLRPTADEEEIVRFVVDAVAQAGPSACPPLFVGVGIGGSFDSVALLAKRALLRDFRVPTSDPIIRALEDRLRAGIDKLGIGPGGLGGETTALGVSVATDKTHIGCLPVAVNISCNQLRSAGGEL